MRILALILLSLSVSSCNSKTSSEIQMLEIPKKPGQVLDPDSQFVKTWPGKPALIKLKDNLVLSVPPQHHKFWARRNWLTEIDQVNYPPTPLDKLPYSNSAGFTMFMPDFGGYTYENYLTEFNQDEVAVFQIAPSPMSALEPDAPGAYPPNQFQRISTGPYRSFDPEKYEEKYGLRCYTDLNSEDNRQICYGKRDSDMDEYLILRSSVPPYPNWVTNPNMQTHYFSPKFGGMEIGWRSHVKNLPRWREIDAQIWKYIEQWNIAHKSQDDLKPSTTK